MDSMSIKDAVLDKKMNGYGFEEVNLLKEYRDLIEKVVKRDEAIKLAETDKYSRNAENERLKKEVATLKAELYEHQKRLDTTSETGDE